MKRILVAFAILLSACTGSGLVGQDLPDLPPTTGPELEQMLVDLGRPAVVNIWASWCGPCRAEAPLLTAAHEQFGDDVEFIGIDVQDSQPGAKDFITNFGLDFDHYFDRDRSVPRHFGGIGTPITFFFDDTGTLVDTHLGVIDDRALALGIDEILNG